MPASTRNSSGNPTGPAIGVALSSPAAALNPLPYASATLTHIRSAALPALLPAQEIPSLLRECHRVLVPGGVLELRIVEPVPERGSLGPKMRAWVDEHVVLGLERQFRTARPGTLVEGWVRGAGFKVISTKGEREGRGWGLQRCLRLPGAVAGEVGGRVTSMSTASGRIACGWDGDGDVEVDAQVGCLVLRALWRDVWGEFVDMGSAGKSARWWWEDNELLRECVEWNTVWQIGTLVAVKAGS